MTRKIVKRSTFFCPQIYKLFNAFVIYLLLFFDYFSNSWINTSQKKPFSPSAAWWPKGSNLYLDQIEEMNLIFKGDTGDTQVPKKVPKKANTFP